MADVHDKATRSFNMSKIKSKNTKPELLVRRFLHSKGFRYKLNDKTLPGKPDIVLPKYRTIIFIHGCFWHGHEGCRYFVVPKTRTEWWLNKISKNAENDQNTLSSLIEGGWNVMIIWECELRSATIDNTLQSVVSRLLAIPKVF